MNCYSMIMRWLNSSQKNYLDFLLAMTDKEIRVRYKMAVLGFLWILLNPLLQMLVMGCIFQYFVPVKVNNYFLFLFVGLLPWNFFSMTVNKCTSVIVHERNLIQKAKFPREVLILSIVLSNFFHFLVAFGMLLFALVINKLLQGYSGLELLTYTGRILTSLGLCIWLVIITSGFSLFLAALNVKFRDIQFVVQAVLPLWFYATPIVYSLHLLPEKIRFIFFLNPITPIVELFQVILLNQQMTAPVLTLLSMGFGAVLSFIGWKFFQSESPFFDDWV